MGPAAYPHLAELIAFARNRVARAGSVVHGLAKVDPEGRVIVPFLCEMLGHKNKRVQVSAITQLSQLGEKAASALKNLRGLLRDKRFGRNVLECLAAMKSVARPAVPDVLTAAREHPAWVTQAFAVLADIDPEGKKAVLGIVAWLGNSSAAVRILALDVLAGFGRAAKRAVRPVRACLADRSKEVRAHAAAALKAIQ
jgi:HEAT repeat protein